MVKKVCLLLMTFFICADFNFANTKRQHVSNVCTYDQQTDVVIKLKESKARGAKLLRAASADDLDSCQENCCQHNGCTLALFHSTSATDNCYFIQCVPYDVCTFTELRNFSISTVSRDNEKSDINEKETSSNSVPAESSPTPTISFTSSSLNSTGVSSSMVNTPIAGESHSVSVTDTAGIRTTLKNDFQQTTGTPEITTISSVPTTSYVPTTTELLTEPTTQQQHTTTKTPTTESNRVVDDSSTESHTTTGIYVDVTEMIMDTGDTTVMQEPVNATANPILNHDTTSTYNKLSSNGALIASLCFSVLFACAVCVLLGKRWYEGYQRRHYSKVDYLINGMYN